MKTTKSLFFELMYDFQSERWNEFELPKLSLRELLALAKLLGCPSCGSKETVIIRLLAHRELRLKLARFADNPEELANSYQLKSLRNMCREAGIWRSGNKQTRPVDGPPELAQSVPCARPSVFRRNAIAGQSPAAAALSSPRSSFPTKEFPFYPCTACESLMLARYPQCFRVGSGRMRPLL